jgi:predicted MPP superfamily phosphohydrolase
MKRIFALILIAVISLSGCGQSNIPVNITQEIVDIDGLEKEFNIFFLADSHISLCDDRDPDLIEKASQRSPMFKADDIEAWDRFDALINSISDEDILILGGDIIDSAMYASIDHVDNKLKKLKIPYIYSMGNHDFEYGSEYFSPAAYEEYLPRLDDMRDDTPYQIREYDDLIIFAADDDNSQISSPILEAYKEVASKKKPIILIVHVPIEPVTGDDSLTEKCKEVWGASADNKSRVTMGVNGCYPNDITREFLDLVLSDDSPVALVLAGHIHFYHKDMLNDDIVQIVTGAAFEGDALRVTLK